MLYLRDCSIWLATMARFYIWMSARAGCDHAAFGDAPLNFYIEYADLRTCLLTMERSPPRNYRCVLIQSGREVVGIRCSSDQPCEIEELTGGKFSIRINSCYLSANTDGIVRRDRSWRQTGEQFRLARFHTVGGTSDCCAIMSG